MTLKGCFMYWLVMTSLIKKSPDWLSIGQQRLGPKTLGPNIQKHGSYVDVHMLASKMMSLIN